MTPVKTRLVAGGSVLGAVLGIVMLFEGFVPVAAPDPIGVPTVCYGETIGVKYDGIAHSEAECRQMLAARLPEYAAGMEKCIRDVAAVPDKSYEAFVSFTYNVGIGAFCGSTLVKRLNSDDLQGACNELPRWVYAGGKKLPGLMTRRAIEQKLCLEGVQ